MTGSHNRDDLSLTCNPIYQVSYRPVSVSPPLHDMVQL